MRYLSVFCLLLLALCGFSQPLRIQSLDNTNGLSSDYILGMSIDKQGCLWVATEEGLNRFDGSRFFNYYKSDGLTGNELSSLLDDPSDPVMWIGTQRDGLDYYNYATGKFGSYRHDNGSMNSISTNDITSLSPTLDGKGILVTTYWRGVDLFLKKEKRFVHFSSQTIRGVYPDRTWCALDAGGGMLYVGHVRAGLSVVDTRSRTARNFVHDAGNPASLSGNDVYCIMRDRQGRVWIGSDGGLDLFDPLRGSFSHYSDNGRLTGTVFSIRQTSEGRILLGTEQRGLVVMDMGAPLMGSLTTPSFSYITEDSFPYGISGNSVRTIIEDKYNNVWIGLYGSGVNFLTARRQLFYDLTYSQANPMTHLSDKSVLSVAFDGKGNLWAGTDGDGINVFTPNRRRVPAMEKLKGKSVQTIKRDNDGSMWAGTYNDNLYKLGAGGDVVKAVFSASTDVRDIMADGKRLLVCTSRGLFIVDRASASVTGKVALPTSLIRCIEKDGKGNFWIGTFDEGIIVCNKQLKVVKRFAKPAIPSNAINDICLSARGLWAASSEGLIYIARGKNPKVYAKGSGLTDINVRAIATDKAGNLWLSTSHTISCLRKGSDKIENYDFNDRISRGSFAAAAVAMSPAGDICFGNTRGVTFLDPAFVLTTHSVPQPLISSLVINGGAANGNDSIIVVIGRKGINLDHNDNTFTVSFSQPDYALNGTVEYSYRLKGLYSDWETTRQNEVMFSNVPYGRYTLEVRCRIHNQQWEKRAASFTIDVVPPFWLSWWAKIIYALLFLAAIWLIFRQYRHRLRLLYQLHSEKNQFEQQIRLNNERMSFFTSITHELRTPLTLILGPLEDLSHSSNIPEKEKSRLAVIYQSSVRLRDLVGRILDFRKTETGNRRLSVIKGNIVDTVREVVLKYEELDNKGNVPIRFVAPQQDVTVWYDSEVIRIIMDNLISNAIKYTSQGGIDVSVERKDRDGKHLVEMAVSDTGYGISKEALPHIFDSYYQENGSHQASGTGIGLSLVKSLVELHHGTIDVKSRQGEGSSFVVSIDAGNTYPDALRGEKEKKEPITTTPQNEETEEQTDRDKRDVVLIVEDNKDISGYIADALHDDFDVRTADNGKRGLETAITVIPDIIISDIMMPVMDGNEMCRKIKSDMRTSHIPVILLTAKDSNASKEEGYDAGADSYITKPFSMTLLRSRIDNLLTQRRRLLERIGNVKPEADSLQKKKDILRTNMNQADHEFFEKLNDLLDKNISGDIDISYLTKSLGMSTSSLYRKMKQVVGMGTNEYVRHYKMQYAEKLLLEGRYTINEISFMVGMSSAAYFRRCFKDEFGDIPSVYIKKIKKGPSRA